MANKKISALTSATLPLAGTEVLPIVQSSTTNNISVNSLAAGNLKSQSTTGVLQVSGPSAGTTRVMTVPDANFTAARTDAGQTFTGNQQINGLVSLSTSPSAWQSNWSVLEFPGVQNIAVRYGVTWVNQNAYINSGGAWTYGTSSTAAQLQVGAGTLDLNVAVSGTAGNAITWLTGIHVGNTGGVSVGNTTDPGTGNLSVNGNVVFPTASKGLLFSGGNGLIAVNNASYNIYIGGGTYLPTEVWLQGTYGYIPSAYNNTTASAANVFVASTGELKRSTSALKYKQNIRDLEDIDIGKFRAVRYKSKCDRDDQTKDHFGLIADEVDAAGFSELVTYGDDGKPEGFQYERFTAVLLKKVQMLEQRIVELEKK